MLCDGKLVLFTQYAVFRTVLDASGSSVNTADWTSGQIWQGAARGLTGAARQWPHGPGPDGNAGISVGTGVEDDS